MEGMQFYIAFIFTGNNQEGEVKEASVVYALEQAVLKMFKAFDKASQTIQDEQEKEGLNMNEVQLRTALLHQFSFSNYYAIV